MSEQAKALAHDILYTYFGVDDPKDDAVAGAAAMIDAVFCPPCPDCGADWKPRAQWKCGSWNEPPARQISVKCVQRQLAEVKAELAMAKCAPPPAEQPSLGDAYTNAGNTLPDGPPVVDEHMGEWGPGMRTPPDAMR